jgi:CheY-like chemotaxis protein
MEEHGMNAGQAKQGLRVLVVEDEVLVSMLIEEMCSDLGCMVVGPAATLEEALDLSRRDDFDLALVDMNLAGVKATPVLAELRGRSIPFAVASGASEAGEDGTAGLVLNKPFDFAQFRDCLAKLSAHLPPNASA